MQLSQTNKFISDIEKEYPVNNWVVQNTPIWPLVRILIFALIEQSKSAVQPKASSTHQLYQILRDFCWATQASVLDWKHSHFSVKTADILFFSSTINRIKLGKKYYERFCDPFIETLHHYDLRVLSIEANSYRPYLYPRNNPSFFIQPLLSVSSIINRIRFNPATICYKLDGYDEMLSKLSKMTTIVSRLKIINILKNFSVIQSQKEFFLKTLKKIKPRLVLTTNYYSINRFALILACKEMSIPTADIQHGVQGEMHPAYAHWNVIPEEGYDMLPDYFLVWGKQEYETIKIWSLKTKRHRPHVIGNLFLEKCKNGTVPELDTDRKRIQAIINHHGATTNVLITAQDKQLPIWLFQAIRNSPSGWYWWLRLHPGHAFLQKEFEKSLRQNGIHDKVYIHDASNIPLYALLPYMQLHVTQGSSVIIEADHFHVPTIIIDNEGAERFAEFVGKTAQVVHSEKLFFSTAREMIDQSTHEDNNGGNAQNHKKMVYSLLLKLMKSK